MKNKISIYSVTHKIFDSSICSEYIPIAVGENLNKSIDCTYIKDSFGENISNKNANYCELTALYWIWKNDDSNIKGICHYRRYFTKYIISPSFNGLYTLKEIEKILSKKGYDLIVSNKAYSVRGVIDAYLDCGRIKDLETTRNVVARLYPEYLTSFDKCMNSCSGTVGNMMIASKKIFNDYAKWLFDILFEVEKNTDISGYSQQEARIYGYISERLMGVYLEKNKQLKVKRCRILNTEEKKNMKYYINQILIKLGIVRTIKLLVFLIKKKRGQIRTL